MKQKDITLIIVIAFISGVFSIIASKTIITPSKNRQTKVEVVKAISADFNDPDPKYFNSNSIDPTRLITIGNNSNPLPFNDQSQ